MLQAVGRENHSDSVFNFNFLSKTGTVPAALKPSTAIHMHLTN